MANDNILSGIAEFGGNVLKGAADIGETVIGGTKFGQRLKQNENSEVSQLLQTYRAIDPSQKDRRSQVLQRIMATPTFQKFQGTIGPLAQSQVDRSQATDKIGKLARAGSSASDFISDELRGAIGKKITQSFADIGIEPEISTEVSGRKRIQLSSFFSEGLKSLKKTSKGKLATKEETQAFADKFKSEAAKAGASPSAAAALFGELHDQETGKRGVFRNDVLPKGSKAASLFATETPAAGKKATATADPIKAFEDFVQVETEAFPEDNTPKTRASLGIESPADQQTMQELEKAAPKNVNVQQVAQQDPEAFKQILSSLRKGKTPSGKPFTIKDALEMMGQI